ncbi:3487_t:CDS:10 [Entrophospora sp. SA101]|nr:3487_t:CDS:10 [Entrophospora sp. SA101]
MPSLKVNVKWNEKEYGLEIDTNETVELFKIQIYTLLGVLPERQKILFKGELLKDDTDFNTLDIEEMVGTISEFPEEPYQKIPFVEDMPTESIIIPRSNLTIGDQDNQRNMIMSLCELYNQLNLTSEGYPPRKFLQSLQKAFPQFAERNYFGLMQQDAEECWSQIMSSLSDINLPIFQNVANISAEEGSSTSSSTQASFVEKYMTGEYTCILKCKDKEALNEEPVILHEPFRKLNSTDILNHGIVQALDERLQKTSPTLNRQAEYSKKSYISRLPSYLTVHFVRFFWKSQQQRRIKITRKILFPFEYDVTEFCTDELKKKILPVKNQLIELRKEREEAKLAKNSDQIEIDNIKKNDNSRIEEIKKLIDPDLAKDVGSNFTGLYDLCAVLTHIGEDADSGHYVAWVCKDDDSDEWLKFDDDRVSTVKKEDIQKLCGNGDRHVAYILLYRSRKIE